MGSGGGEHLLKSIPLPGAAVSDAVIPSQIGGRLAGGNQIIGSIRLIGRGHGNGHDLRPKGSHKINGAIIHIPHRRRNTAGGKIADAHTHSPHVGNHIQKIHRTVCTGGIQKIPTADGGQHKGAVRDRFRHNTHLIQGGRHRDHTATGNPSVSGLHTYYAAIGGRYADAAARVGSKGIDRLACGHDSGTAAGASARHVIRIDGISANAESRGFIAGAHSKFVQIGLAEEYRPLCPQALPHIRTVGRHEIIQHPGSTGGEDPLGADIVLQRHGNAAQQRCISRGDPPVRLVGGTQCHIGTHGNKRTKRRLRFRDPDKGRLRQGTGRNLPRPQLSCIFSQHDSTVRTTHT